MKNVRKIITILLMIFSVSTEAKSQGGIYMSAADYKNNKLTYGSDSADGDFKIHLHDFFGTTPSFTVAHDGKKETLQKNQVFGFHDCNDNAYRFYANAVYKIVGGYDIYIYTRERNVAQSKGFIVVTDYFFSKDADSKIIRLSIDNLVRVYANDSRFINELENYNGDVTAYDCRTKMFKINYLLTKSLK